MREAPRAIASYSRQNGGRIFGNSQSFAHDGGVSIRYSTSGGGNGRPIMMPVEQVGSPNAIGAEHHFEIHLPDKFNLDAIALPSGTRR